MYATINFKYQQLYAKKKQGVLSQLDVSLVWKHCYDFVRYKYLPEFMLQLGGVKAGLYVIPETDYTKNPISGEVWS